MEIEGDRVRVKDGERDTDVVRVVDLVPVAAPEDDLEREGDLLCVGLLVMEADSEAQFVMVMLGDRVRVRLPLRDTEVVRVVLMVPVAAPEEDRDSEGDLLWVGLSEGVVVIETLLDRVMLEERERVTETLRDTEVVRVVLIVPVVAAEEDRVTEGDAEKVWLPLKGSHQNRRSIERSKCMGSDSKCHGDNSIGKSLCTPLQTILRKTDRRWPSCEGGSPPCLNIWTPFNPLLRPFSTTPAFYGSLIIRPHAEEPTTSLK